MTNPNDAAFPTLGNAYPKGLTKREYFAAMAMQGILAHPKEWQVENNRAIESTMAGMAVCFVDALIDALNKTEEK